MGKSGGVAALVLLALPAWAGADEPEERESEWEMPAGEAWSQEGFRVQIRVGRDLVSGLDGAPNSSGIAIAVEPGIRLSEDFSLSATLRYSVLADTGFEGLRWTTTADATWHPWGGFFLAAGVGYAGLIGNRGGFDESLQRRCDGSGAVLLARTGWLFALGELFSMGPVVQLDEQWTRCPAEDWAIADEVPAGEEVPGIEEREGEAFTWRHRTLHFAWSFAWR
ncbi:hypothetical protein [Vulgatibacter sp.]|uniref:hypothetical protein n=1 Tax=Vulgatibacter sp. TaxID=1971226 RepID=UPI003569EF53